MIAMTSFYTGYNNKHDVITVSDKYIRQLQASRYTVLHHVAAQENTTENTCERRFSSGT
jgi:hypothetical protein